MTPQILLATGNPGKVREFRLLLNGLPCEFLTLNDLRINPDVPETGSTYRSNAALKARAYSSLSRLPTLSDDSGLEVLGLGGVPGIRSARYAPQPAATDADRRHYLLSQLEGITRPWSARFCCVVAVVFPDGSEFYGEGVCTGEIIPAARGTNGFGYDPIFQLRSGKTMAELSEDEKNRLSHRARAVEAVRPQLLKRLKKGV